MTDWGASGRTDSYELHLVDPFTLQETGETVETIEGKSTVSRNYYGENLCSASITMGRSTAGNRLVRVYHTARADGAEATEVLGTFFVDSSTATAEHGSVERTCACYSTLWRHTQDYLATDFAHPAGTNVVGELRQLVEADGGQLRVLGGVDESREHTRAVWFQVGDGKGETLRTIAGWCGWRIGVDPYGHVTVEGYVPPSERATRHVFEDGANCTYLPGYDYSDTTADACNRVIASFSRESKQDDPDKDNYDPYPLSCAKVADLPAESALSYERIGRHRTLVDSGVEPCSPDDLQAYAERMLYDNSGAVSQYRIRHVGIPGLDVGDVVEFRNGSDGTKRVEGRMLVAEMTMELGPGCMCETTLKDVVRWR